MHHIHIKNYQEWRHKAREFLYAEISPEQITWIDTSLMQCDLFEAIASKVIEYKSHIKYMIPTRFFKIAETVSCHRDERKWSLLYEALWRIVHEEKNLLDISSDPLVNKLLMLEKSVQRDIYKMKAFVRFREYIQNNETYYIAWYQPDHSILGEVSLFFKTRFSTISWMIITPEETMCWNGEYLKFLPGIKDFAHSQNDKLEDLWKTYYSAIFNPARINMKAMRRTMPKRFWQNLPETTIINEISKQAPIQVTKMLKNSEGISGTGKDYFPDNINFQNLRKAANNCKACPIYQCTTHAVFGHGNENAEILIISEQPSIQKDTSVTPLNDAINEFILNMLNKFSVDFNEVYFTYAVKHLKSKKIGDEIIEHNPTIKEIYACKPWLEVEIELVKPSVILCLGLVAAKSILNPGFHLKEEQKKLHYYQHIPVIATYHPSSILKIKNKEMHMKMTNWFSDAVEKSVKIAKQKL